MLGVAFLPFLEWSITLHYLPSPKKVMGNVKYYCEESYHTLLPGEYSYKLRYDGDLKEFHRFAKGLELGAFKVSEKHYKKEDGSAVEEVKYVEGESTPIQFHSYSW